MESPGITLLDLPAELIHSILVHAILVRGLKRGLRLRLVNKFCSREVIQALYTSRILESLCHVGHEYPPLGLEYLQFKTLGERGNVTAPRKVIRQIADRLCVENDIPTSRAHEERGAYIKQLCRLAFERNNCLSSFFQEYKQIDDDDQALKRHLFVAAVYTNSVSLVRRLINQNHDPWASSSLFGFSLAAAALKGHEEIIQILLATCSPHSIRRYVALSCSSEAGHLGSVELVLQPQWGPWELEKKNSRDRAALSKALNTPNIEVFNRIMAARGGTPLQGPLPEAHLGDLINTSASSGWVETTQRLLAMGAPADGFEISQAHRPIMEACRHGFSEIVKLLLDHGADTYGALSKAASGGHLGIIQMLLDHGCDVNEGSPPAIVHAVDLEHVNMFYFLREKGAILNTPETGVEAAGRAKAADLQSMLKILATEGVDVDKGSTSKLPPPRQCSCPQSRWR
ncbi:hypothetical protein FQN54_001346 [Arachnomyces sp. PD_36]|nr:hypothetical protein FQN54_001346 [Arachnomyces sp. PD_36]